MSAPVVEATIAELQAAILSGDRTAVSLVEAYTARIEAYDRAGPEINAIVTVNPNALEQAAALDASFASSGELAGPLHGIPVLVKDQAETRDVMTCFGSIAMDGYVPETDATVIQKLREAGAIVLAKTSMPDFATSWFAYSSKSGTSRNPYQLDHDPGGSSSGTGAAIAANLGAVGIGEDTGGSIRLPASFDNLVGLKVTPGLVSRAGMSPLVVFQDSAGPMCRTVEDAARVLNVVAGFDEADPFSATAAIAGKLDYCAGLRAGALEGRTIGVLREAFGETTNPDAATVNDVIERALADIENCGGRIVDITVPDLAHYIELTSLYITHSRHDIDAFLAARPNVPMASVEAIHAAGKYHPALDLFEMIVEGPTDPWSDPEYYQRYTARESFQRIIVNEMAKADVSALVFPTTQIPAPSRADLDAGLWTTFTFPTNTLIAAQSWLPALSVPAGFTPRGLPVGMEMVGLPYAEQELLGLAYAYEQATNHRRAPECAPEITTVTK